LSWKAEIICQAESISDILIHVCQLELANQRYHFFIKAEPFFYKIMKTWDQHQNNQPTPHRLGSTAVVV
jgi:hypothetical protein